MKYIKYYTNLIVGIIVFMFLGLSYTWSVFVKPLEKEFGWGRDKTSLVLTIFIICFCVGSIICGYLQRRSEKLPAIFSSFLLLIGFFTSSKINHILSLYVSYGIIGGLGTGIAYNYILGKILRQYSSNGGVISGVLLLGYGTGGFVFSPLLSKLLNSSFGWRNTFLFLGFAYFILMMIIMILFNEHKENNTEKDQLISSVSGVTSINMIKTKVFRLFYIWILLSGAYGLTIVSIGAAHANDIGISIYKSAVAIGLFSIGNGSGRILVGYLFDKTGLVNTMKFASISFTISTILLLVTLNKQHYIILITAYILAGFTYSSVPTLIPCLCKKYFGLKNLSYNLGITNTYVVFSSIIGSYFSGIAYNLTGSYNIIFYFMIFFSALALVILFSLKKQFDKPDAVNN